MSPDITPEMRASAKSNPNTWLYVIDPLFEAEADVPPWGVVGAYPVDATGEIEDNFQPNDRYRPSPQALRMPAPESAVDELLQLIRTGHRDPADLPPLLRESTLLLYARSSEDHDLFGFPDPDGRVFVPVCTVQEHVPAAWPGWREITGGEIARLLNGFPLLVNPIGPLSAIVPAQLLAEVPVG
nr:type VII secretion system-associated protein [Kibdelosporangium sp. MJ126-NF4]CEL15724.1 putative ADP-ribosylglycohydrolase [Kibdelosporangium sp. MJ126-NF4]CTQ93649.1 putative ADP-ribosylglycohydrolase [Kibdelosporangium sp. MJ126-NF4]